MRAVPLLTPVTIPLGETPATAVFELAQDGVPDPLGVTIAVNCRASPT
jgi:hypothetical protein